MPTWRAWLPYLVIGAILLVTRLEFLGVTPLLQSLRFDWEGILGTSITRGIAPFYNPGIIPFLLIAVFVPALYGLGWKRAGRVALGTVRLVSVAAIALFFALGMVFIMMNSGEAAGRDSMLIVMAGGAAAVAGQVWYLAAPLIGMLGTFISGSNTVSDIMFGAFQFNTANQVGLPVVPVLALQAVGGAAGNMICIHNVVAVLTTVGLLGKEGIVVRKNLPIAVLYALAAGAVAWLIVPLL